MNTSLHAASINCSADEITPPQSAGPVRERRPRVPAIHRADCAPEPTNSWPYTRPPEDVKFGSRRLVSSSGNFTACPLPTVLCPHCPDLACRRRRPDAHTTHKQPYLGRADVVRSIRVRQLPPLALSTAWDAPCTIGLCSPTTHTWAISTLAGCYRAASSHREACPLRLPCDRVRIYSRE